MVSGWRLAFCTTVPKDTDHSATKRIATDDTDDKPSGVQSTSRFGFFSSSSTPKLHGTSGLRCRTASATAPVSQSSSVANSPKLSCKTSSSAKNSPRMFHRSCPSSPTSATSFSLLKSSLRLSRPRCGVCLQSVKPGQGTAIFTAECSHGFHFPCVVELVKKQNDLVCPVCSALWKELPLLENRKPCKSSEMDGFSREQDELKSLKTKQSNSKPSDLKIYNDDEPLMSPTAGGRFNPIPESDYENDDDDETGSLNEDSFQGFFTTAATTSPDSRNVGVSFLPEAAVVSAGHGYETHAVVMEVKAPPLLTRANGKASSFRAPVDLVAVVDVSDSMSGSNLQTMKRAMRVLISSLSSNDRLSIVAFSACSKRLLPLRRMTVDGRRTARRIIDVVSTTGQGMSAGDAVRKAAKVLEDRRVKNSVASIIVFSTNGSDSSNKSSSNLSRQILSVNTTRLPHLNILVHSFGFESSGACKQTASIDEAFVKSIQKLLCVPVQDLRLQFGSMHGSVEVKAVYTCSGRSKWLGSGTGLIKLGDFHAEENREILIELRVPTTNHGAHLTISVRSSYTDPSSQQLVMCRDQSLTIPSPNPNVSGSSSSTWHKIERLRCVFISARAVAESKRVAERNDFSGAQHLLSSARALLIQSKSASAGDYVGRLEAELAELKWKRQQAKMQWEKAIGRSMEQNKVEALTPTSAWRTAERLAKVARMRKSLNRVSDLHGFENARF
ncbi:hypothetical protein QQ045_006998 [Rhodiola kirilowii]